MLACGPRPKHSIPVCGVRYVAWERRHPCMCVRPGRTNPQPRCCTQIHDTLWHSSQRKLYTLATLDDLCTVCNTCKFIPLRVNYNISRYHTCSHAAHGPNIAFQCVASDMWRGNADTHACVCVQDARISSQDAVYTLATLDDLCNTCQFIPLRVIEIGDTD